MARNGATYHRCDLQVHSPRDPNWKGIRPSSEQQRKEYASNFVSACRARGLDAIAITDHHDLSFFYYIREAAADEVDDDGQPIEEDLKLIVFPGMELTLGVPCQALLIFDADFPKHHLSTIPTILGITPNDTAEQVHADVSRLEHIKSISDLCSLLDTHEHIRNHYIVLPNVSDNKGFSLIRKGFASHYKSMPCVGAYVDGSIEKLGDGNRTIIDGKNREYGFKSVGVFQTSDSRRADFSELGANSSWIKWAVPTAEALRQACLARQTRIANTEPQLPALVISQIEVSNSKFMGPIDLYLNSQLNCFIGGRGTGKSTVLEYLRWALCDQPPPFLDEDELPDFQRKRTGLIQNTLVPFDSVVTVSLSLNGIRHIIRRNTRTSELLLKVGDADFEVCHEDTIKDLLPIQAYSQKQLSTVGVRTDEIIRFVRTPIAKSLRDFQTKQEEIKATNRNCYLSIQAKRILRREIEKDHVEITSLEKQLQQLRNDLKGLSKEDQAILAVHNSVLNDERIVNELNEAVEDWRTSIDSWSREISIPNQHSDMGPMTSGSQIVANLVDEVTKLHHEIQTHITNIRNLFGPDGVSISRIKGLTDQFSESFRVHTEKYEAAKSRSTTHESKLVQISQSEQRLRALRKGISEKERQLSKHGSPEDLYESSRSEWERLHSSRADALEERCNELTTLSGGRIKAQLRRGAGVSELRKRLAGILSGTRIRSKKIEDLCDLIANSENPLIEWATIQKELEQLATIDAGEDSDITVPASPVMSRAGFTPTELDKIARKMTVEEWLEMTLLELEDMPVFEYEQREGEYIDFADASAGQQATALLRVLLNQEGPPLLIDQPEEDLDNPVILEIVEDIWSAKAKRQIIFASHNANLVVNGDADLVVCCDYRSAGDQTGGQIRATGAIDVNEIKIEITKVMEGGHEAFRLRKEKYGF